MYIQSQFIGREIIGKSIETTKTRLNALRHELQTQRFRPHHALKLINQQQCLNRISEPYKQNEKQQIKAPLNAR